MSSLQQRAPRTGDYSELQDEIDIQQPPKPTPSSTTAPKQKTLTPYQQRKLIKKRLSAKVRFYINCCQISTKVCMFFFFLGLLFYVTPSLIDAEPTIFEPRPSYTGALRKNRVLSKAEILLDNVNSPEGVAVDSLGRIYTASASNGTIFRLTLKEDGSKAVEVVANTRGHPMGMMFDPRPGRSQTLLVCDAMRGLLSVDTNRGTFSYLSTEVNGRKVNYASDLDVSKDGIVYYSDATDRVNWAKVDKAKPVVQTFYDALEGKPRGRVISHNLATGKSKEILAGLYFPYGLALLEQEGRTYLLVAEAPQARIRQYLLTPSGDIDTSFGEPGVVFASNLPGFPHSIRVMRKQDAAQESGDGAEYDIFVGINHPRTTLTDFIWSRPWIKEQLSKFPYKLLERAKKQYGLVVVLNEKGETVRSLHDPRARKIHTIGSMAIHNDLLYIGSETGTSLVRSKLA